MEFIQPRYCKNSLRSMLDRVGFKKSCYKVESLLYSILFDLFGSVWSRTFRNFSSLFEKMDILQCLAIVSLLAGQHQICQIKKISIIHNCLEILFITSSLQITTLQEQLLWVRKIFEIKLRTKKICKISVSFMLKSYRGSKIMM